MGLQTTQPKVGPYDATFPDTRTIHLGGIVVEGGRYRRIPFGETIGRGPDCLIYRGHDVPSNGSQGVNFIQRLEEIMLTTAKVLLGMGATPNLDTLNAVLNDAYIIASRRASERQHHMRV